MRRSYQIVFLLPTTSQPRYHKRISALKRLNIRAKILAFQREYYRGRPFEEGHIRLGAIRHGEYLRRLGPLLRAIPRARLESQGADSMYAFGLDMLALGWLARLGRRKHARLVYEVGDVREVMLGQGLVARMLRSLERFLLRRTHLVVVTSRSFVSEYFHKIQGETGIRYEVVENKVNAGAMPVGQNTYPKGEGGRLRIGYFGLIRCKRSLEILRRVTEMGTGRVGVYARGIAMGLDEDGRDILENHPYIQYDGPYVSPDDLPAMYGYVDIVWTITQYHEGRLENLRWARTNRFNEACWFRKPMIAQTGTEDGKLVEDLDLGLVLDLSDVEGSVRRILRVEMADLKRWQENIARLPPEVYTYTDEHERLLKELTT